MTPLDALENQSIYIFREAYNKIDKLGMLWSLGKDSNVMLWLARKAFLGHVPFPVIHVDTGKKFPEMYDFRTRYTKEWGLDLIAEDCPPIEEIDPSLPPATRSAARKTEGLKRVIDTHGFTGVIAGIRRDEQATRAKERVFSPRGSQSEWDFREQPPEIWDQYKTEFPPGTHVRIHPLLHWTEVDIWRYIQRGRHSGRGPLFRQGRQALPILGRPGHNPPGRQHGGDDRRDHRGAGDDQGRRALRSGHGP